MRRNSEIYGRLDSGKKIMNTGRFFSIFRSYYPQSFAESWDKVGIHVGLLHGSITERVLLCNDLTPEVLEEAIQKKSQLILSYHPVIFQPLSSLNPSQSWKEEMLVKCIQNNISVYSVHTTLDVMEGGMNDHVLSQFDMIETFPIISRSKDLKAAFPIKFSVQKESIARLHDFISLFPADTDNFFISCQQRTMSLFIPQEFFNCLRNNEVTLLNEITQDSMTNSTMDDFKKFGVARTGKLRNSMSLYDCIVNIKKLTHLDRIRMVNASSTSSKEHMIRNISVCVGSGESMVDKIDCDLFITGEMSHHKILDLKQRGTSLIICEHSNSERHFLTNLSACLKQTICSGYNIEVNVSQMDRDPIEIV